ncbi:MAG TPA: 50S ribosomal protein L17 [Bacteroidales bacterium]|jgi:large subunit ribosomal protein L17|nr:50S ribosomal protein L17 [Bacteroidales bacterium]
MRHAKRINHLGRTSSHRAAMLSNMATSLIRHKRITTTVAKAKALRSYIEPLITRSKKDTTHSRRIVFSFLQDKYAVSELFRDIAPKIADRPGGYTRILKTGFRQGDNAEMCIIELVDYNETYNIKEEKKATRTRRSRSKKAAPKVTAEPVAEVTEEPTAEVAEEPTAEVVEEPAAEVVEEPVAEVTEEPVAEDAPATEETTEEEENTKKE